MLKYVFEYGYKKGFSEGYEDGKQNERKLQIGKSNLLREVERLEEGMNKSRFVMQCINFWKENH